jgi:uncharacterized protein (UPF0335 family)
MTLPADGKKDLQRLVDQIERLEEEKKALTSDITDKFLEAKSKGFDVKVLKRVLAARKKSQQDRESEEMIYDTYCLALGMAGTPLGDYAERTRPEVREAANA